MRSYVLTLYQFENFNAGVYKSAVEVMPFIIALLSCMKLLQTLTAYYDVKPDFTHLGKGVNMNRSFYDI